MYPLGQEGEVMILPTAWATSSPVQGTFRLPGRSHVRSGFPSRHEGSRCGCRTLVPQQEPSVCPWCESQAPGPRAHTRRATAFPDHKTPFFPFSQRHLNLSIPFIHSFIRLSSQHPGTGLHGHHERNSTEQHLRKTGSVSF